MLTYDSRQPNEKGKKGFMVATDKFMSGWGQVPNGKSYVAYDCTDLDHNEVNKLEAWMKDRKCYIRVRYNANLPRGTKNDHLAIYSPPKDM